MHTVPQGYFKSFTFADPNRRDGEAIFRFDRSEPGQGRRVGLNVAEVNNDIYTVFDDNGAPDTGIEDLLCKWEGAFCAALRPLVEWKGRKDAVLVDKDQWVAIARFISAQMLRTPAMFERMKTFLTSNQMPYGRDDPPRVMFFLIRRWVSRLARMKGSIIHAEGDLPLLTSDNPVALWNGRGQEMTPGTADHFHPNLTVSCPLTPRLLYMAEQTTTSLAAVHDEGKHKAKNLTFVSNLIFGTILEREVKKLNALCVKNAHKRVYANYCDPALLQFLENTFWFKG